jgi:hypothetical protein
VSWLLGGGALSSLAAVWVWFQHQPSSIIATVFIVILSVTFVCVLAYLGYRQTKIHQVDQPPQEIEKLAPERVPLLDMVAMARKGGWDTDAVRSNDASDLTDRLNQAAADRTIKFGGANMNMIWEKRLPQPFLFSKFQPGTLRNLVSSL